MGNSHRSTIETFFTEAGRKTLKRKVSTDVGKALYSTAWQTKSYVLDYVIKRMLAIVYIRWMQKNYSQKTLSSKEAVFLPLFFVLSISEKSVNWWQ